MTTGLPPARVLRLDWRSRAASEAGLLPFFGIAQYYDVCDKIGNQIAMVSIFPLGMAVIGAVVVLK